MKEYQYLIGKIIVAVAIIVAAIIIAQAIGGAGESIRSSLLQLRDALRQLQVYREVTVNEKSDFMEVTKMMPTIGIMTIVSAALTIYLCHDEYKMGK